MPAVPPEAVFFDLDGTLADTAPDLGGAANRLRAEHDLAPLPLAQLRPHTSSGVRGMLGAAFGLRPEDADYAALAERFLQLYEAGLSVHTRLFEGMPELLDELDSAGVKWGVVTNKRERYTLPLMAALGLERRASCIISGDSAARPKPAPDPLLLACERAGVVPGRCVYLGDDLRDIESALAAGMTPVAAAWGYLGEAVPIASWGAAMILEHPRELPGRIPLRA